MPCSDCSRAETCPPCVNGPEGPELCPHEAWEERNPGRTSEGVRMASRWCTDCGTYLGRFEAEKPEPCAHIGSTGTEDSVSARGWHFKCDACGAKWSRWDDEMEEELPMAPEEAPCEHGGGDMQDCPHGCAEQPCGPDEGPECTPCVCGHTEPEHAPDAGEGECWADNCECPAYRTKPDFELPPQPERRPPYAVAYAVQGHLYEVALPGDATVEAVDGALVIRHALGQVAGIVAVNPMNAKEES